MKLLQKLQSKKETSSSGIIRSFTYGLYECPYCNSSVELRMQKGNKQKSCGSDECSKKSHSDGYNYELSTNNAGNTIHNYTNDKYYNSVKEYYRTFIKLYKEDTISDWHTLSGFMHDMLHKYKEQKEKYNSKNLKLIRQIPYKDFGPENTIWISNESNTLIEIEKVCSIFNSKRLSYELNSHHRTIVNGINRMINLSNNFGSVKEKFIKGINNTKIIKIFELTENQYETVKKHVQSNKINTNSSILYLIQSVHVNKKMEIIKATKIGIASNINKRLQALSSSSPNKMILRYHTELEDVKSIEKELHKKYKINNIKNEWFHLSAEQIDEIIKYLNKLHDEENKDNMV